MSSNIRVAVRPRPLRDGEKCMQGFQLVGKRILLGNKTFDPDDTFSPNATADDVFASCMPIIESVKNGTNGTVMVYGQTGSGKTHTMIGSETDQNGLAFKATANLLEYVSQRTAGGFRTALTLSMLELYNEHLTDMLSSDQSEIQLIQGIPRRTEKVVLSDVSAAAKLVKKCLGKRQVATTSMNERSSRSHVIIMLTLEEFPEVDDRDAEANSIIESATVATLFLVDLAGSESIKKSQVMGKAAAEAGTINKSLLALKMVILALTSKPNEEGARHIPYRDSKLTQLLQDSIGGSARTMLIACISCVGTNIDETQSTLEYASRARSIRNVTNTERDRLSCRVRSLEGEIQKLKNRLQEKINEKSGVFVTKEEYEGFQVACEENTSLKNAVDDLMKDKQQVEARQHIRESQITVLHQLLKNKDVQVDQIRRDFEEAILKIDTTATELTRVHKETLNNVQTALVQHTASSHQSVMDWVHEAQTSNDVLTANQKQIDAVCDRVSNTFSSICSQFMLVTNQFVSDALTEEERRYQKAQSFADDVARQVTSWRNAFLKEECAFHDNVVQQSQMLAESASNISRRHPVPDVKPEIFDLLCDAHSAAVGSVAAVVPASTLPESVLSKFSEARQTATRINRCSIVEPIAKENNLRMSSATQRATGGLPPMSQRNTTNNYSASTGDSQSSAKKRSRTPCGPSTAAEEAAEARRSGKPAQRAA